MYKSIYKGETIDEAVGKALKVGDLATLNTKDRTTIVAAINETANKLVDGVQPQIADLEEIREGASKGSTAVQPRDLSEARVGAAAKADESDTANLAQSANRDSDGNVISTTYIKKSKHDSDIAAINNAIQNGVGTTGAPLLPALSDENEDESQSGATAGAVVRYAKAKAEEVTNEQMSGMRIEAPMTEEKFNLMESYTPNTIYLIYE